MDFLSLQEKENIHSLSVNIKLICVRYETATGQKGELKTKLTFLPHSKARTNLLYIFRQCTCNI